jgi:hypothetical protein
MQIAITTTGTKNKKTLWSEVLQSLPTFVKNVRLAFSALKKE